MTDEQRLQEIRERRSKNTGPNFGYTQALCNDIDFLLNLVDSQVAEDKLTGEKLAEQIVNASLCAEPAGACEESAPVHMRDLVRSVAALTAPQYDALCEQHRNEFTVFHVGGCLECWKQSEQESTVTSMRSACIEKVEEFRQRIQYCDDEGVREALFGDMVIELQSLTIREGNYDRSR